VVHLSDHLSAEDEELLQHLEQAGLAISRTYMDQDAVFELNRQRKLKGTEKISMTDWVQERNGMAISRAAGLRRLARQI
jgi:hypothetical protein